MAMESKVYLAVDVGAESGRVMAGIWDGRRIELREIYRFPNGPMTLGHTLRWDVARLWLEIQKGLALAGKQFGARVVSVGVDTWGVDFVWLNCAGEILEPPFHYRDSYTEGMTAKALQRVSKEELYALTGLQFMPFNTLFQLLAWQARSPEVLAEADCLLFMPDFLHWSLCGVKCAEFTIASTSQFVHPAHQGWAVSLLEKLGLPIHFLPKIVAPGTDLGKLHPALAKKTGLTHARVVVPPSHDTASAVAGVPTARTGSAKWAYISSGTWSLMGVELKKPVLSPRALELNLTNEGGIDGTCRLLKTIMGLWLVQQCRRSFAAAGREYNYAELGKLAANAPALRSLVNPNASRFLNPPDMPDAMQKFCNETGQALPQSDGQLVRCARESLALMYRETCGALEELTGEKIDIIHIVGGGSNDQLLNQMTADACQRTVLAGPVEATALGNLLTQVRASGELASLDEMRDVIRTSTEQISFQPKSVSAWDDAAELFAELRQRD
ncbi:MAG: rhamnulokinase [Verrucomicrobiota bacterium]|jgi:rhamnulokinase